jgi:pentatricopeptide repeat protein
VVLYNGAINACARAKRPDEAFKLIELMKERGCCLDCITYNTAILACTKGGEAEKALKLFDLLCADDAVQPDNYSFNVVMHACQGGRWKRAIDFLESMSKKHGLKPDVISYSTAAAAVASGLPLEDAQWRTCVGLLDIMAERGIAPDKFTYSSVITCCAKAGRAAEALRVFWRMEEGDVSPNVITYSGVLRACANAKISPQDGGQMQYSTEALQLLARMREQHTPPISADITCINDAMASCVNDSRFKKGLAIYDGVRTEYGLRPNQRSIALAISCVEGVSAEGVLAGCKRAEGQGEERRAEGQGEERGTEQLKFEREWGQRLESLRQEQAQAAAKRSLREAAATSGQKGGAAAAALHQRIQQHAATGEWQKARSALTAAELGASTAIRQALKKVQAKALTFTLPSMVQTTRKFDTDAAANAAAAAAAAAYRAKAAAVVARAGCVKAAAIVKLVGAVVAAQPPPELFAYTAAINACAKAAQFEEAAQLWAAMGRPISLGYYRAPIVPDSFCYNCMLSAAAKAGQARAALQLMDAMTSGYATPAVEAGYATPAVEAGYEAPAVEAAAKRQPNRPTAVIAEATAMAAEVGVAADQAVGVASSAVAADQAVGVASSAVIVDLLSTRHVHPPFRPSLVTFNCVLSACEKSGAFEDALQIVEQMLPIVRPNLSSINATIGSCCRAATGDPPAMATAAAAAPTAVLPSETPRSLAAMEAALRIFEAIDGRGRLEAGVVQGDSAGQVSRDRGQGRVREIQAGRELLDRVCCSLSLLSAGHGSNSKSCDTACSDSSSSSSSGGGGGGRGQGLIRPDYPTYWLLVQALGHPAVDRPVTAKAVQQRMVSAGIARPEAHCWFVHPIHGRQVEVRNGWRDHEVGTGASGADNTGVMSASRACRQLVNRLLLETSYRFDTSALPALFVLDKAGKFSSTKQARSLTYHAEKKALALLLQSPAPICMHVNCKMCRDCHTAFECTSALHGRELRVVDGVHDDLSGGFLHVFTNGVCSCARRWR